MNTVVEQYIEFSWTSQEQNGKMKITLTWTNDVESLAPVLTLNGE
jgi:hypothetical protein